MKTGHTEDLDIDLDCFRSVGAHAEALISRLQKQHCDSEGAAHDGAGNAAEDVAEDRGRTIAAVRRLNLDIVKRLPVHAFPQLVN